MDQKHSMLYPELQSNARRTADQRAMASLAIGLPTDPDDQMQHEPRQEPPPPSYDAAITANDTRTTDSWYPSSPTSVHVAPQPLMPNSSFMRNQINTRSFDEPTQPAVNIITQQHFPKLGPHPCTVFCPSCGTARMTRMAYTPNNRTHFCALLLCLVGWCCCACFVPYCTTSCRTGNHYCSVCNSFLGSYDAQDAKI